MLLKEQRNVFFKQFEAVGITQNAFNEFIKYDKYSLISTDKSGLIFSLQSIRENGADAYLLETRPGIEGLPEKSTQVVLNWATIVKLFRRWSSRVKKELDTPDLWAEAAKTAQLFAPAPESSDDKFTRTELAEVQGQLRLLQQRFEATALPEAARQKLVELTATAAVKAEGFTKKDWQGWFIGSLISTITSLAFNPTQAHDVYMLVKSVFSGLFLH